MTDAQGWQPIETAPRDGTYMLVSASECGCEIVAWLLDTWVDQAGMTQGNWPTHWQPLPPAPATPARADLGERGAC